MSVPLPGQSPYSSGSSPPPSFTSMDEIQATLNLNGYLQANEYEFEPGVCVLPLAATPPTDSGSLAKWSPVCVLQLHAPYRVRRTNARALKQNNPPVMQAPTNSGAFVFVGGTLAISNALNSTYTNFDWFCEGNNTYVENCVSRPQDGLVLGITPFTFFSQAVNQSGGTPAQPQVGAIASAGLDAIYGYGAGQALDTSGTWGYNTPSFYPGNLFNGNLINGGPGVVTFDSSGGSQTG